MPVRVNVPEAGRWRLRVLTEATRTATRAKEQADRELAAYLEGILVGLGQPTNLIGLDGEAIIVEDGE